MIAYGILHAIAAMAISCLIPLHILLRTLVSVQRRLCVYAVIILPSLDTFNNRTPDTAPLSAHLVFNHRSCILVDRCLWDVCGLHIQRGQSKLLLPSSSAAHRHMDVQDTLS
ncbi:hypothetical protein XPA_008729 [Xanthoria parietina]